MKRSVLVIAALAAAAAFFGWKTYDALTAHDGPVDPPAAVLAPDPAADNAAADAAHGEVLAAQVAAIVAKPLFRPDRMPGPRVAPAPGRNYDAELSRLTLVGVLLQRDAKKGVVMSAGGKTRDRWEVGAGDSLPGFQVIEVQVDGLILESDKRTFLLPLYAGGPKEQPGGPLRTEASPGTAGAAAPARPAAAPPNPGVPAAAPAPPPATAGGPAAVQPAQPGAPQSQGYPVGGRFYPRPPRLYPYSR